MSKVLAVFGATGQQGSSVVNNVLSDPQLSQQYKLRAITRDVDSEKARKLKESGVEVVKADTADQASIDAALNGVHTVFIMTVPDFGPNAVEVEYNTAKNLADTAVKQGVEYIIFSTLPSISDMSGGRYTHVTPFEAKAKAEQYIRSLPVKSAFCSFGFFMENLEKQPFLGPRPGPDGTWVLARPSSPKVKLPYLDAVGDVGKFVGVILAEPDKYEGKTLCAAQALYTLEEIAAALSKNIGKSIVFKQISLEEFRETLPFAPDLWIDGILAQGEQGYFGPGTDEAVAWAVAQVKGKLTTLDEYLEAHPLKLAA
jgi:uncharacterized protein YbjT (DUF2867 family)